MQDTTELCEKCPCAKRLEDLERAFPEGPYNHRAAHEAWIEAKKAEADFWRELKLEIAKKGALGLLYLLGLLALVGAAAKLGILVKP